MQENSSSRKTGDWEKYAWIADYTDPIDYKIVAGTPYGKINGMPIKKTGKGMVDEMAMVRTYDFGVIDKVIRIGIEPNLKKIFTPKRVIYNGKTTIVHWEDGTKTVVSCKEGEEFNEDTGFAMACLKKIFGSRSKVLKIVDGAYHQPSKEQKQATKAAKKAKKGLEE